MKERLSENFGAATLHAAIPSAIALPVRTPRAPEYGPRKLARPGSGDDRLRRGIAKKDIYREMLRNRCVEHLRLSPELTLVLTMCESGKRTGTDSGE